MGTYVLGAAACVVLATAVWSWGLHLRQQRRIEALEGRVASLLAGLSLLTDTTESGLRDVTAEIGRVLGGATASRPRSQPSTHRRVANAARRGHSVQAIAAAEEISEGEVKLRLSMTGAEGERHAEVR